MKIVIEVHGEKVTAVSADHSGATPVNADIPPGPAPAELLARAKKLGAKSAGPAAFGIGVALAAAEQAGGTLEAPRRPRAKARAKKRPRHRR
jgi:hypothetical protein